LSWPVTNRIAAINEDVVFFFFCSKTPCLEKFSKERACQ
jgi:hypothetical protein